MNESEYQPDDVCCPKCGGLGYLNYDYEPGCDLCCELGVVSEDMAKDYQAEPVPVEYWWAETEDGRMVMVKVDNE